MRHRGHLAKQIDFCVLAFKFMKRRSFLSLAGVSFSVTVVAGCNTKAENKVPIPSNIAEAQPIECQLDVPYLPTPQNVVEEILKLADVKPSDILYDLGSGDGRVVITAAKTYGTRGVGVELDPQRIEDAKENAKKASVTDRVQFLQQDLFQTDISKATVVTIYLLPEVNLKLRPELFRQLKPGTRVVSHEFDMGKWKPQRVVRVQGSPSGEYTLFRDETCYTTLAPAQQREHTLYFWVIPKNIPKL